jgi:hypothetical protein
LILVEKTESTVVALDVGICRKSFIQEGIVSTSVIDTIK